MSRKPLLGVSASARARVETARSAIRNHIQRQEAESEIRTLAARFPSVEVLEAVHAAMTNAKDGRTDAELTRLRAERIGRLTEATMALHALAQSLERYVGLDLVGHLAVMPAQRRALKILALAARPDKLARVAHCLGVLAEEVCAGNDEYLVVEFTGAPVESGGSGGTADATWLELSGRLVPTLLSGRPSKATAPAPQVPAITADRAGPLAGPTAAPDPPATAPSPPGQVGGAADITDRPLSQHEVKVLCKIWMSHPNQRLTQTQIHVLTGISSGTLNGHDGVLTDLVGLKLMDHEKKEGGYGLTSAGKVRAALLKLPKTLPPRKRRQKRK